MTIRIKRIYEEAENEDGYRILVDRLWPRGLSKQNAKVDFWAKEISPSTKLRQWYNHDPEKWTEFKSKYAIELENNLDNVEKLLIQAEAGPITFLFSSKELKLNNAVALKDYLESKL